MVSSPVEPSAALRVRIWYGLIILIVAIFGIRLFYVQVIRYDHFKNAALSDQLRQYQISAARGTISVHEAGTTVPIVLNQRLYTLYADPVYVKDAASTADKIARVVGGQATDYESQMSVKNSRYVVLARKLSDTQRKQIANLKLAGIGTQEQDYRTYPQGTMASQLLGFVSSDGQGEYGVEQALNQELAGKPGELRAITDVNGVPLAASSGNVRKSPQAGDNILLTLDLGMQRQLEGILQKGVKHAIAESGSAIIIDPHSGAIKAMANYPTYNPADYDKVHDVGVFNNAAVSHPIEIGSTMKTLTTAAALDQGVIRPNTTYYDPYHYKVDGFTITNIEEDGVSGTKSIADILNLSLNTGATWELMQMGGGEINRQARDNWYDYLSNHYRFGKATGIEQGYEATGVVPKPQNNGAGINLTYANTAFGQAMTATPVQMAGAVSAMLNGGTYYQPHLLDSTTDATGRTTKVQPKILAKDVVSPSVSHAMIPLLQNVVEHHYFNRQFDQEKYIVGGKTGTAQIAKPTGGYYDDLYNGTYVGFVGGDNVQYVIVVFIYRPKIAGYAGTAAAQPVFEDLAHMLIDNSYASPKSR